MSGGDQFPSNLFARYGDANENGQNNQSNKRPQKQQQQQRPAPCRQSSSSSNGGQPGPPPSPPQPPAAPTFKPFTRESLQAIQKRREQLLNTNSSTAGAAAAGLGKRRKTKIKSQLQLTAQAAAQAASLSSPLLDPNARPPREPDPYLASGQQLPPALVRQLPPELVGKPIEDIDPYYEDQETFVIISRGKELTRFSAKKALYLFGPFHPIRRVVLYILVNPIFNLLVITTILINCILMTIQGSEMVERTEIIFTIVYTTEMGLKVLARGFILDQFTYLRDPWNWLDFAVIIMAYLTIVVEDLGNLSVMRTFRVLRALKTVAIIPGMKTIVGAVIDSVKNLKDVVVLTLFSLSVFSLLGLQIYMGILTQKCIKNSPNDNMTDHEWYQWNSNNANWIPEPDDEIWGAYRLCGNATGAQSCPDDYTCLQGFGKNPDYGFTNFDTFGWALICSFRLMTQDFWEGLYMQVLKTAGSWHIIFFVISIFLGSIYLMNLILAIVAMSYNELQRRAEEEEEAAAQDEAAFLESCRLLELQDQMSQVSGGGGGPYTGESSPEPPGATSYRPSVEIGLVGQSLLASLCQNGLLGQHIRDKLDQQMMLPGVGGGGGGGVGNVRSHSLSVNLERRESSMSCQHMATTANNNNNNTTTPNHLADGRQAGQQWTAAGRHLHNPQYDPPMVAASMTELRRKSSVRTNETESPTHKQHQQQATTKSHLGQRRLLPNIGVGGNRLDSSQDRRNSSRSLFNAQANALSASTSNRLLFPHHVSSGVLTIGRERKLDEDSPDHLRQKTNASHSHGNQQQHQTPARSCSFVKRFATSRSSTTSDRDLQLLKQRAAMIRIEDRLRKCSYQAMSLDRAAADGGDGDGDGDSYEYDYEGQSQLAGGGARRRQSENTARPGVGQRYGSVDLHRRESNRSPPAWSGQQHEDNSLEPPPPPPGAEMAVCEQPTSARPFGLVRSSAIAHKSSIDADHRRRSSARLSSIGGAAGGRRPSTMSNIEQLHARQVSAGAGKSPVEPAAVKMGGSMRTLRSTNNVSTATNTTTASSNAPAAGDPDGGSGGGQRYLRPEASRKMHHLSVENFQLFGNSSLNKSPVASVADQTSANVNLLDPSRVQPPPSQQHYYNHYQPRQSLQSESMQDYNNTYFTEHHQNQQHQQQQVSDHGLSQQPRVSRARLESRQYIHPSTMVRSSFSRPRQSNATGGGSGVVGAPPPPQSQPPPPSGMGRRLSRDFVRRASDWSRLSMSANVDLRRLLKLWSHTNPYQGGSGARQSFGSCSQYSQQTQADNDPTAGGQYSHLMMMMESPGHWSGHQRGQQQQHLGGGQSPRPSSVGSAWQAYEIISAMSRRRPPPRDRYQSAVGMGPYGGAMPLDDSLMMDRMSINWRDKCLAYCLSCLDILCIWECCGTWLTVQRIISQVVFDPFTELFIIFCILINTLFMALDSDDTDDQMRNVFEKGNYFFTGTFAVEALMKIMALSPKFYFREGWNVFDAVIVVLSLLELCLQGVYGLSVLRSFRLLRVFKLAKSWPTLNLLISIMGKAVGDLGNLTFVLAIIVFIFAVMGMQLFGTKYQAHLFPSGQLPRWNFTDFMHSFMIVFRILCAEWIEPMWDCLLVGGWPCIPFFLIAVTVGNLVVLNLFLALLLASFGASNLSSPQADNVDTKKLQEAIGRFRRFGRWLRRSIGRALAWLTHCLMFSRKHKAKGANQNQNRDDDDDVGAGGRSLADSGSGSGGGGGSGDHFRRPIKSHIASMSRLERLQNIEKRTEELKNKIRRSPEHHYHLRQLAKSQLKSSGGGGSATPDQQPLAPPQLIISRQSGSSSGFNYNYLSGGTGVGGGCQTQIAPTNIPIIVNEAAELTGGGSGGGPADDYQQQPSAPTSAELSESSLGSADLSSLDFNCTELDATGGRHRLLTGSPQPAGSFATARGHSIVNGYSNNMQPIREDSKDDSYTTSLSNQSMESTTDDHQQQQQPEETLGQLREPLLAVAAAGLAKSRSNPEGMNQQVDQPALPANNDSNNKHRLQKAASNVQLMPNANDHHHHQLVDMGLLQSGTRMKSEEMEQPPPPVPVQGDQDEQVEDRPKSSLYLRPPKMQEMEEDDEKTLQHIETYIEKCIWFGIICLKWFLFRQYVRKIVEHKYFDQCILILIVISSGTLALEDKHLNERPALKQTLDVLDTIFTIIFSLEMVCKWLAFGMRRYFGNIWSWLDFIIVLVSFVNLMASIFGSGKIQALKTMRTLRAMRGLRPLRALQRFQGMRVVVNALIQAIPSIFNVLLVCLIFWLIFSIMGVQMFGGKFWRCLDPITKELVSHEIAANKSDCLAANLTWANPQINFDNVLNAYLALFQVATFKGWIDIMNSATDSGQRDEQPIREANIYMYSYFVFFVIFGSFFTLNLFIGVIIDNFNEQKKKTGGSLEIFMTDDQKKYYHAMKKMRSKKPIKAMTRPKFPLQAYMFDITTSKKFDLAIMLIIGLNMFVMALEHYGQSQEYSIILENLNLLFIAIFTLECLCKIFAMRHFYFREPWNVFDFIVVSLSILGVVMKEYVAKYFVSPTLLRVVRVVKVGRVLRLVKGAKGIRTLLFALAMSLPALFNICLLLFLVMFIYAIFGMSFFMNVRKRSGIDETFNFETFSSSIIILFQMSTSAGWDLVLDPLMDEENDCQKPDPAQGIEGTCGNKGIAIAYLISYVIVTFLIIINMYIAVILENYSQATEDVQEGLTDDDYEMYYEIWQKFDPNGSQYLPYSKLSDFVDALEDPLRIPKPNELALVVLDINIYKGNQCYCVDILDALTKYFFTRKGYVIQVNEHLQRVQSTLHETPFERVTTTYLLKREHYCAKVIQNCWRHWKERAKNRPDKDDLSINRQLQPQPQQQQQQLDTSQTERGEPTEREAPK